MRVLRFKAIKQRLIKDSDCEFQGLIAGSDGYVQVQFDLSPDWDDCNIAASFWIPNPNKPGILGKNYIEHSAVILDEHNACIIPAEVLKEEKFQISLLGGKPAYMIPSSRVTVTQDKY